MTVTRLRWFSHVQRKLHRYKSEENESLEVIGTSQGSANLRILGQKLEMNLRHLI